jgi:2-methylcitrate dehydratase
MDRILEFLTDYATTLSYRQLPDCVVHEVKRRIIDTLGCAMGCYHMGPPKIVRAHALEVVATPGATILGTRHRSSPELAAFANGVMARYLDFNDTTAKGGHPSDNIMPVLAAAEYAGANLETLIEGIVIAYEVQDRFGAVSRAIRVNGWDNAIYVGIATALGSAKVMALDREQTANAVSLAVIPNGAMNQTRVGHLSMWKGCSAPNAARNGVFAALMARRGISGPHEPFEGPRGFKKLLGASFDLPPFGGAGEPYAIEADKLKHYPCDYEAQCSVTPALELHPVLKGKLNDIAKIDVETYDNAVYVAADTRDKWNPASRETADHSIPYAVAAAMVRGSFWLDDFEDERIRDPRVLALMQKMDVRATDEFNQAWPEAYPFRITVTLSSGQQHVREVRYAKGHPKNPMSDQDIAAKFLRLSEPVMGKAGAGNAIERLWHIDQMKGAQEILALFALD